MFKVEKISPNSIYVARGEPLKINVTLNRTNYRRYFHIEWSFRRSSSRSYERVLLIRWRRSHRYISMTDKRFSAVGDATLLLANTTLNDSGTYMCEVFSLFSLHPVLYFNITVEGWYDNLFIKLTKK